MGLAKDKLRHKEPDGLTCYGVTGRIRGYGYRLALYKNFKTIYGDATASAQKEGLARLALPTRL